MKPRLLTSMLVASLVVVSDAYAQVNATYVHWDGNGLTSQGDGRVGLKVAARDYVQSFNAVIPSIVKEDPNPHPNPNPYLARRQVTSCNSCHVAVPKLNTYGRYVKNTGFELPELDLTEHQEFGLKKFSRFVPFAVRGIIDGANGNPSDSVFGGNLDVRALQILGGGALFNNRVSWWLHTHVVEDNEFVNPFTNTPHELWAQYNLPFGGDATRVSVRGGMAELPLWFAPSKTKLSEIPYGIYDAAVGENTFTLSRPQFGVMLNGAGLDEVGNDLTYSWSLAAVNGQGDFKSAQFTQVFGRVTKTFPTMSVGAFGFVGSQDMVAQPAEEADGHDHGAEEHAEALPSFTDRLVRVGVDVEANVGSLNIMALGLYGRNSNPEPVADAAARSYYGGFIGADFAVAERLVVSARYDGVRFRGPHDLHEEEAAHHEEAAHEEAGHAEEPGHGGAGHLHGELVTSNLDALVFGANYMLTWQLRLTTEYRRAFKGLDNKWIAGLQFAF